jgi:Ser/Thr protein kinase RdoA (MazF antagonist)
MHVTKELIERHWPLTGVVIKDMPLQGMGGMVGIVEAKESKYTYKIAGHWKTPGNLNRDLSAYDFLNSKGFEHISKLLYTKNSKRFIQVENKLLYLIEFIEGTHPEPTVETWAEIGKITATLHNITGFTFESDYRPKSAVLQAIEKAHQFDFKEEYVALLKKVPSFEHLPMVPIHTEITPSNTIQRPDGKIMIIDWDEVGIGPAVLDLGVGLINKFVTNNFKVRETEAKAYFQAYFSLHPMIDEEKEYIFEAAIYWGLLWVQWFKGEAHKRFEIVKWAIEHKEKIIALYM